MEIRNAIKIDSSKAEQADLIMGEDLSQLVEVGGNFGNSSIETKFVRQPAGLFNDNGVEMDGNILIIPDANEASAEQAAKLKAECGGIEIFIVEIPYMNDENGDYPPIEGEYMASQHLELAWISVQTSLDAAKDAARQEGQQQWGNKFHDISTELFTELQDYIHRCVQNFPYERYFEVPPNSESYEYHEHEFLVECQKEFRDTLKEALWEGWQSVQDAATETELFALDYMHNTITQISGRAKDNAWDTIREFAELVQNRVGGER